MKDYEQQVFEDFEKYANVVEAWPLYDTIVICKEFYGQEQTAGGWFTTFVNFAAQETHSFFKTRTEGIAGLQYTNQQSSDSMDFAFIADSIGVAVIAPAPDRQGDAGQPEGIAGDLVDVDDLISHWFASDLPRHMGIQLKVQQDIRAEINCMDCPPGYGSIGSGTAYPMQSPLGHGDMSFMTNAVVQGVPLLANRYPLPAPIGIPRTATIEGILHVSEYARNVLSGTYGPRDFAFNTQNGLAPYTFFPARYMLQFSLIGQRLVQQRGQYHR